jgi:hypothetical protein
MTTGDTSQIFKDAAASIWSLTQIVTRLEMPGTTPPLLHASSCHAQRTALQFYLVVKYLCIGIHFFPPIFLFLFVNYNFTYFPYSLSGIRKFFVLEYAGSQRCNVNSTQEWHKCLVRTWNILSHWKYVEVKKLVPETKESRFSYNDPNALQHLKQIFCSPSPPELSQSPKETWFGR